MIEELQKFYGQQFEPELLVEISETGIFKKIPEGRKLMDIG